MTNVAETAVLVQGDESVHIGHPELQALPRETKEIVVSCASGLRHESAWTGVRVGELLAVADAPPETTHIAVTGADGCHVYVELADALSGLVATERDGETLDSPRLVVPGIDGMRTVKDVVQLEAVALAPDEDPRTYEHHPERGEVS
ncbi:Oxidoreductase molybdopterin binding domain-containing protein [Halogranum amylolyticum]|uniref:Oxidoreductase molybdopterin binding domain-containing protein n=1 Tax=Halogranum amylolyticum TaxID=660520 RepID=A0A1H8URI9_9EURY|nr:molybdopterin-dependent oxidoreductase [Halogranum amylolyticum]SEP05633.1 Oxidoreductase molybdopterin binding domain-containing protein [Halogranum amylolyticum]